ncbi:tRNA (adenosine(37)-N6)-threonylcarbamoyltransferase complex ATPase subunit type 1 TsaE [Bauldia sp.]|uniref:tRNA (adenosine(37)-N6)-threonylcarbamoyltransferase complex ATPase subunit type 1 TsaE n=1 Tax=Bauldia sp. TaxID=2575872 RepID=UPI003BAAEEBE
MRLPPITLADEAATIIFAEDLAARLMPGDLIALGGGLGVGKTTLARTVIRSLADDPGLEVPSPTFTLAQHYADGRVPVIHFDLYRLASPDELTELGFEEALAEGAVLVEWPERADLPDDRLDIALEIAGDGRRATVSGTADKVRRFARSREVRQFLERSGRPDAARQYLQGDASTRVYERVVDRTGQTSVLMDWPPREPSSDDIRAAFRAKDVGAFVAVDRALRDAGFSAPDIYAADLDAGLLLLEDLGTDTVAPDGTPDPDRYACAVDLLADLHAAPRPGSLPIGDGRQHRLPMLNGEAMTAELDLFVRWYLPHITGAPPAPEAVESFYRLWAGLFERLVGAEQNWTLFDVQSPNLPWLSERTGIARVGLLDFQDMFVGPTAFDVASLCQDMRVTAPPALETALRDRYLAHRRRTREFDEDGFLEAYAILAAERTSKNLGVFARLADRDGRTGYLRHIPRLREYLARALAHPALSGYAQWCRKYLPS